MRHARRRRPPVVAATLAGDEEPHLHGGGGLAGGERLGLAGLLDYGSRELVTPPTKRERDLADDVAALDDRARRPLALSFARGRDRRVDVVRPRAREAAERRAVRGPQLLEPLAGAGRNGLARDEVRDVQRYQADQPPSTTRLAPVTYDEASEARKTTAPSASFASAIRPSGTRAP